MMTPYYSFVIQHASLFNSTGKKIVAYYCKYSITRDLFRSPPVIEQLHINNRN